MRAEIERFHLLPSVLQRRLNECLRSVGSQKGSFVHCYDGVLILHFGGQNRCLSAMNERHAKWRKDTVHQQFYLSLS